MSQDVVKVQPMHGRSTMTLEDIRDAMVDLPPDHANLTGGWGSTANQGSNLGVPGASPPNTRPVIHESVDGLPRMLKARFYYWGPPPVGVAQMPNVDVDASRRLSAIDVVLTKPDSDYLQILMSTRTRPVLHQRSGAVASLQKILKVKDAALKIDRYSSRMDLEDTDIFLWLTVQQRDRPQIAPEIKLDKVSGISGRDASARTADLRAGIDFSRANFLTAVAEADTLGPIEISFVHYVKTESRSFQIRLHVDGGFEVKKSDLHFSSVLVADSEMEGVVLSLAYLVIPRINSLFVGDAENWTDRRLEVIGAAMTDLESRYASARKALAERMNTSPAAPAEGDATEGELDEGSVSDS